MKKYLLFFVIIVSFNFAGINFIHNFFKISSLSPKLNLKEEFDASLYKLTTMDKVVAHVNALYGSDTIASADSLHYANLMARTLRMRFYHGWSQYGFKDNWVLYMINPIHKHSLGIVAPNDILKYPEALCSQQAIIGMMALRSRGYSFRKVGFHDPKYNNGHFTFEILLNDGWHYYDLDMEPNLKVMESNNRPSIDSLASNTKMRRAAYSESPKEIKDDLIINYDNTFPINVFPAKNMLMFHRVTMFLSYTLWLWIGLFYGLYRLSKFEF